MVADATLQSLIINAVVRSQLQPKSLQIWLDMIALVVEAGETSGPSHDMSDTTLWTPLGYERHSKEAECISISLLLLQQSKVHWKLRCYERPSSL